MQIILKTILSLFCFIDKYTEKNLIIKQNITIDN